METRHIVQINRKKSKAKDSFGQIKLVHYSIIPFSKVVSSISVYLCLSFTYILTKYLKKANFSLKLDFLISDVAAYQSYNQKHKSTTNIHQFQLYVLFRHLANKTSISTGGDIKLGCFRDMEMWKYTLK